MLDDWGLAIEGGRTVLVAPEQVQARADARRAARARRDAQIEQAEERARFLEGEARLANYLGPDYEPLPPTPQLEPVSAEQRAVMDIAGRGSGLVDPTRTGTPRETVQELRGQFGGPGDAGYALLAALLGRAVANQVPGATAPLDQDETSGWELAANVAAVLPSGRVARALYRAQRALRAGRTPDEAAEIAMASMREKLPIPPRKGRPNRPLPDESAVQAQNAAHRAFVENRRQQVDENERRRREQEKNGRPD